MKVLVLGGGITGRLVHHRVPTARVFDHAQPGTANMLTRSFGANYLWQPIPGIPYREFPVLTHVDGEPATEEKVARYKAKIGKMYDVADINRQFRTETIGYDFTHLPDCPIEYNKRPVEINLQSHVVVWNDGHVDKYDWLVSTIPMYNFIEITNRRTELYAIVGGGRWAFSYDPIYVRITQRPPDAPVLDPPHTVYVNYLSDPAVPAYRYCDRGSERHYESIQPMGAVASRKIVPGKIHPVPNQPDLVIRLTEFNVVTFGRFASWRPDELVHETWNRIDLFAEEVLQV